jgi:hypothetical protein
MLILFIVAQTIVCLQYQKLYEHQLAEKQCIHSKNKKHLFSVQDWEKAQRYDEHEISIRGKMFDFINFKKTKHCVIAIGHFDTEEDEIISQYETQKQKDHSLKKGMAFNLIMIAEEILHFNFFCEIQHIQFQHATSDFVFTRPLAIESPPPRA